MWVPTLSGLIGLLGFAGLMDIEQHFIVVSHVCHENLSSSNKTYHTSAP